MKIPQYTAQLSLTKDVPGVRVDASAAGQGARSMGQVGDMVSQFGEQIRKVRKADEIGKATIEASEMIKQLESEAVNDNDLNDYLPRYNDRLNKVRNTVMGKIKDREAAQEFGSRFELSLIDSRFNIKQIYTKKSIDSAKATLNGNVERLQEEYINTSDPRLKEQKLDEIAESLTIASQTGILSKVDKQKSFANIKAKLPEKQAEWDIYNDPSTQEEQSQVLAKLKDKTQYPDLNSDSRLKLIKDAQARIFQNNQTVKRNNEVTRDGAYDELFTKIDDGTLTLFDFDEAMQIPEDEGGIPKKQLITLKKAHQTKIKNDLQEIASGDDRAEKYINGIAGFIANEDDKHKARENIVRAFADHVLSPLEMKFLNQMLVETKGVEAARAREKYMGNNIIPFKNAFNAVNDFFFGKVVPEAEKALAIKSLIVKMASGMDAEEAKQKAISEMIIKNNPAILNFPEEGQKVMDANGNIKIMFPDGTYKDAPTMKPKEEKK